MNYESFTATNVGKVRKNNEDNFYVNGVFKVSTDMLEDSVADKGVPGCNLYSVCDGMGGEEYGEKASMIAVSTLKSYQGQSFINCVGDYLKKANEKICEFMMENDRLRSGTTFAALSIENGMARVYNVGDSRVYMIREGKIKQLSVDHTRLQQMINMGVVTDENAKNSKDKHVLTQHLGIFPDEMEISPFISDEIPLRGNDVFLLCSDGLTDMLTDEEIQSIINSVTDIKLCVNKLIEQALAAGGRDNVTVQIVKCTGENTDVFRGQNANGAFPYAPAQSPAAFEHTQMPHPTAAAPHAPSAFPYASAPSQNEVSYTAAAPHSAPKKNKSAAKSTLAGLFAVALAFCSFFATRSYLIKKNNAAETPAEKGNVTITAKPSEIQQNNETVKPHDAVEKTTPAPDTGGTELYISLPDGEITSDNLETDITVNIKTIYEPRTLVVNIEGVGEVTYRVYNKIEEDVYTVTGIKLDGIKSLNPGDKVKIDFTVKFKDDETIEDYTCTKEYILK